MVGGGWVGGVVCGGMRVVGGEGGGDGKRDKEVMLLAIQSLVYKFPSERRK